MSKYIYKKLNENFILIFKKSSKKIIFVSPLVNIPFGMETFKNKSIINIGIGGKKSFYNKLKSIDTHFSSLKKVVINSDEINFEDKKYVTFIREKENYEPLIRIVLEKKNGKIITKCKYLNPKLFGTKVENNFDFRCQISPYNITKNSTAVIKFEFSGMWIYGDRYGLLFKSKCVFLKKNQNNNLN